MRSQHTQHSQSSATRKVLIFALIVILILAVWGIVSRIHAASKLHSDTEDAAIANVTVMKPIAGPATEEIILPGTVQAWHEAPIFARTNGYLKDWKTDIGAHVKAGDVLAEIDTPEIDAQTHQAEADLATAVANNTLAQTTAVRWKTLLKTNSVSKQETDEKVGDAQAKAALVAAARASLDRLHQLELFKRVVAPFDGVVTARNTDTGALINSGSTANMAQELFHVADVSRLRIYVQVPENYAPGITPDLKANLHFIEYPGRSFPAQLIETAKALDPVMRTLLVEFEAENTKGELMPGGYTEVHFNLGSSASTLRLPANTLLFRAEGLQVVTVDANSHAQLKSIKQGRDFGKEVEVLSGITPEDSIVINPPDSVVPGQLLHVTTAGAKDDKKKGDDDKKEKKSDDKKDDKKKDGDK